MKERQTPLGLARHPERAAGDGEEDGDQKRSNDRFHQVLLADAISTKVIDFAIYPRWSKRSVSNHGNLRKYGTVSCNSAANVQNPTAISV